MIEWSNWQENSCELKPAKNQIWKYPAATFLLMNISFGSIVLLFSLLPNRRHQKLAFLCQLFVLSTFLVFGSSSGTSPLHYLPFTQSNNVFTDLVCISLLYQIGKFYNCYVYLYLHSFEVSTWFCVFPPTLKSCQEGGIDHLWL